MAGVATHRSFRNPGVLSRSIDEVRVCEGRRGVRPAAVAEVVVVAAMTVAMGGGVVVV